MDNYGYDQLNARILITGANGYIGRHLIAKYKEKKFLKISKKYNKDFIKCDLTSKNDILNLIQSYNITKIINLASFVPKNFKQYQSDKNNINELIIYNIIELFKCELVHISSLAIYEGLNSPIIDEASKVVKLYSNYSLSKYNSEHIILNKYNYPYLIMRIPGIFGGDRKSGLIYNAIKKNLSGKKIKIKSLVNNWSAMYIDDLLEILYQSKIKSIKDKKIINVNYQKQLSMYEIINIISKNIIKEETYSKINKNLVNYKTNNFLNVFNYPKNTLEQSLIKYIKKLKNVK